MDFRRSFDIPLHQSLVFPQKAALSERGGIGKNEYSSADCLAEVMRVSAGALDAKLGKGDKVAIISRHGSPRWTFLDLGLQQVGVVPVPLSPDMDDSTLRHILNEVSAKAAFVEDRPQYERLLSLKNEVKSLRKIHTLQDIPDLPDWEDFVTTPSPTHLAEYELFKAAIHEDDLATIVYTGGTTGSPKGVMLSHKNLVSNIKAILAALPITCDHTVVSMLPQHQIFERITIYTCLAAGAQLHFLRPSDTLMEDIKDIRPHYFTCIPELLERFYKGIIATGIKKDKRTQRRFLWAINQGRKFRDYGKQSIIYYIRLRIADLFVFRRWRQAFGGRIEGIVVGADALSPSLGRLFSAAGIDIREGYGMAEAAPVISINRFGASQVNFGTVGQPLDGVEVRIGEPKDEFGNGDIEIQGDNVMMGYWQNNALTKASTTDDGWFKTGDIGRFTAKRGFLQIAGRRHDRISLANEQVINPLFIETQLKNSPYIGQCMVVGQDRPHAAALIVPSFTDIRMWCQQKGIEAAGRREMILNEQVVALFVREIKRVNEALTEAESIRSFKLLGKSWTVKGGELSPAYKKKRKFIRGKYQADIAAMYRVG